MNIPPRLTPDPLSVKAMLRLEGSAMGGAIRARMTSKLDDCLWVFHLSAIAFHGDPEQSACQLWKIVSKDPSFRHPLWLELLFKRHRAAIIDAHHNGAFRH